MKVAAVMSSINVVNTGKGNNGALEYVFQTYGVFEFTLSCRASPND